MGVIGVVGSPFAGHCLWLFGVEADMKRRENSSGASLYQEPSLAPSHIPGRLLSNSHGLESD